MSLFSSPVSHKHSSCVLCTEVHFHKEAFLSRLVPLLNFLLSNPANIYPSRTKNTLILRSLPKRLTDEQRRQTGQGFCRVLCRFLCPLLFSPGSASPDDPRYQKGTVCLYVELFLQFTPSPVYANTRCFCAVLLHKFEYAGHGSFGRCFPLFFFLCLLQFLFFFSFCSPLFFFSPPSVFPLLLFFSVGVFFFSFVPFSPLSALRLGQARYQKSRCTQVRQRQLKRPRQTRRTGQNMHRLYAGWCADTLGRMSADIRFYQPFRPFFVLRPGCQDARMPGCDDARSTCQQDVSAHHCDYVVLRR